MAPKSKTARKSYTLQHREYIGDVISGPHNSFSYDSYAINPGNSVCFPWMSQIAQNFEQYRFRKLVFEYVTMSADALNSVNTALGQVIMSAQYNAGSAAFNNKQTQEQYDGSISVKPSRSVNLEVDLRRNKSVLEHLYIRNQFLPEGTPIQFTDFGEFQISTNGLQGDQVVLGELWVSYDIEFVHPKQTVDPTDWYTRYNTVTLQGGANNHLGVFLTQGEGGSAPVLKAGVSVGFRYTRPDDLLEVTLKNYPPGQYTVTIIVTDANTEGVLTGGFAPTAFLEPNDGQLNNIYNNGTQSWKICQDANTLMFVVSFETILQSAALNIQDFSWTADDALIYNIDVIVTQAGNPQ